ncbi:hypothetical protein CHS0354_005875 [Potamilus streckersoni]|uniref:Cilia- and flagella-associated protein 97 n=1 Tax=Potamilus streckersoni TaxID=2493646 RepID=A0AAE0T880_9BIVA|nr:hypothetical protein CHS0354_005875 [Potamilus streckersoni]
MTSSADTRSDNATLLNYNKLLQMQWDQKYCKEHKKKLKEAKPMVDTKAPATFMHVHLKLKKLQLEEERLATLERDNRILLDKMSNVRRIRSGENNSNKNTKFKSLNREKQQRFLSKITEENLAMLYRVIDCQPEYSHKKWQQEWKKNQRFMESISHFPKVAKSKSARKKVAEKTTEDDVKEKDNRKEGAEEFIGEENTKVNGKDSKKEKDAETIGDENRNV